MAARTGAPLAPLKLLRLALDRDQPDIVRATALDLMRTGRFPGAGASNADAVTDLLSDPSPLVRGSAARLQETIPAERRLSRLLPLLEDPRRAVRIAAAQSLVDVDGNLIPQRKLPTLRGALGEYRASLLATADFPETQMNLAALASRTGNRPAAIAALQTALEMDAQHLEAWRSLGTLQNAMGQFRQAEETFLEGIEALPEAGDLHRLLGLLYAERGDFARASKSLEQAAVLQPGDARVHYNLALALQREGRQHAAETAMRRAVKLAPRDPDILYAFAALLSDGDQPAEARKTLEDLLKLYPTHPQARDLLNQISLTEP